MRVPSTYKLRAVLRFDNGRPTKILDNRVIEAATPDAAIAEAQRHPFPFAEMSCSAAVLLDEAGNIVWTHHSKAARATVGPSAG